MKIKKNVGRLDLTLRLVAGSGLFLAGFFLTKTNFWLMGIGLAISVVGLIGFCPFYVPFGISTRKRG